MHLWFERNCRQSPCLFGQEWLKEMKTYYGFLRIIKNKISSYRFLVRACNLEGRGTLWRTEVRKCSKFYSAPCVPIRLKVASSLHVFEVYRGIWLSAEAFSRVFQGRKSFSNFLFATNWPWEAEFQVLEELKNSGRWENRKAFFSQGFLRIDEHRWCFSAVKGINEISERINSRIKRW